MTSVTPLFLDTNIFLRHVTHDHPQQSPQSTSLFLAIESGQLTAWTSPLAIAEIVWVLSGTYRISHSHIRDALLPLINLPGLRIERKSVFDRAFDLYVTLGIDYIDCYHAALLEAQGERDLYSYDTDFDRIPSLQRREP